MPITAKVTFNFRYKQAGNSFSLYNVTPSLEQLGNTPDGKSGPVEKLIQLWMQLLGTGVECPYVRVSDETIVGDSLFFDRSYITIGTQDIPPTGINTVLVKTIESDFPDFYDTSALVVLSASTTQKGRIFMRFIPDDLVQYPLGLVPNRNWDNGFKAFVKQLIADKWCIRSLADANVNKRFKIKAVTRTAAGENLTVETFEAHGIVAKDTVRVSRVVGSAGTNGVFTVDTAPSATTLTLLNTAGTTVKVGSKGTVRKLQVLYPAITAAAYRYATRRKSGRPFGAPRGRQKRRPISL